jgi:DNA-binding MarR family transcriptional regulator
VKRPGRKARRPSVAAPPIDLRPLTGYLGYALRRAQMTAHADFLSTMAHLHLSPAQFGVLTVISQNPGSRQCDLGLSLGIQKTNLVPLLNKLGRRGLAKRKPGADRRTHALYLTAKGRALLRRAHEPLAQHEARLVERIGERSRGQLLRLLGRLGRSAW